MYCPKCGQPTVHLNGRDICTKCGIVFDSVHPREQILSQIKSKVVQTRAKNSQETDYTSPIAIASQARPFLPQESPSGDFQSNRTVEEIQRETRLGKEAAEARIQPQGTNPQKTYQQPTPKEPTIYEFNKAENMTVSDSEVQNTPIQSSPSTTSMPSTSSGHLSTQNQQTVNYQNTDTKIGNGAVYPSHEVNPILIKIFISVFSTLIFFVIVYVLYVNFGAVKAVVDNIIKFLGERIFR